MNTVIASNGGVKSYFADLDIKSKKVGNAPCVKCAARFAHSKTDMSDGADRVRFALSDFSKEGRQTWVQQVPVWHQVAVADAILDLAGSIQIEGDVRVDLAPVPFSLWVRVTGGSMRIDAIWLRDHILE